MESHTIDTSTQTAGPTIEESAAALIEEGVIEGEQTPATSSGAEVGEGVEERPSWLPEKFKTPEDMAKAYGELEKKQSAPQEETPPAGETEAEATAEAAGLDVAALTQEFDTNGELSDASYKALEDAGFSKEMVDGYINGLNAQQELYENSVKALVPDYDALTSWGEANLDDAAINAFDAAVNSGNMEMAKAAVEGLQARMELNMGQTPERQLDGKSTSASDVYESQAQIEADMNDPRYMSDPAFRAKVYAKMDRSNI